MANLEKIIKVTQEQYDILASGGKVGDYVGLQDNYVYMIEDTNEYITTAGGVLTGNLCFKEISNGTFPVTSSGIVWNGSTDGAAIYYRVDASDAGRLVFQTKDDSNCNFVWNNTVSGNGDVMTLTGNGNLTVKGDITSNGNKVALDKDVVKLTGNQTISNTRAFSGKIINTYLQQGIIDTHSENNGTILGYYTNDWAYLLKRGYSCAARNVTQNTTIEPDECWFDTSPSYDYLSLTSTSDVVEIIIKGPAMWWTTRGGIGFGNPNWRAKNVKIEVGYTATNTGTASNPDKDIVWVTRINVTNQGNGIVFGNINGPTEAEGGHQASIFNYMRLTLTNWNNKTPRIAQIFTFNTGSIGLHNAFLSKSGGNFYGSIWPTPSNTYDLGNNSNRWASVHATTFYENGAALANKYLGINGTAKTTKYLISPSGVLTNADISDKENTDKAKLRIDLATSSLTTNKPDYQGFIYTNIWDIKNSKNNNTQLYIPNGYHITAGRRLSVRGCRDDTWQTSWKELAYYSDLDNYTKKAIPIPDNTSLDTVTESGFYRLNMNPNFPHAQMIVCRGADTIAQMVFPYDTTRMYVRTGNPFNTSGGLWHDWKQVEFTDHTHTSINTAFVFNNNDMPEGSANLSATTNAHQISFYRNGLSVPYQMDNSNDGGILRCRGNSESNVILELATWDDSGAGETIQFNYYPTNSQATPTYSVTVPKKTGTILLTTDSSSAGNAEANKVVTRNDAGSIQTEKLAVSSGTTTKATMQYNSTEDCIEFIFA